MSEFSNGKGFNDWLAVPVSRVDQSIMQDAQARQQQLTKPAGSLGELENLAIRLAAMQKRPKPEAESISIAVFAADHGIAAEGVSAFPQAVTAQMVANFANGGAAISVLARALSADLQVVNMGTATEMPEMSGVEDRRIAAGTANFAHTPAMDRAQLESALLAGRNTVDQLIEKNRGLDLFIAGEMGIANTSSATALAAVMLNLPVAQLVGPGTGLDSNGISHKQTVLETALELHSLRSNDDPLLILQTFGGFEIAAIVGAYLHCAKRGVPMLVDGFICTVAALFAQRLQPEAGEWMIFAHSSAEPGYQKLRSHLSAKPLLDLGLRLGEASGAAVAVPLVRLACELHNRMATFAEAAVSDSH